MGEPESDGAVVLPKVGYFLCMCILTQIKPVVNKLIFSDLLHRRTLYIFSPEGSGQKVPPVSFACMFSCELYHLVFFLAHHLKPPMLQKKL